MNHPVFLYHTPLFHRYHSPRRGDWPWMSWMRVTEVNLIPGRGYQSEPQSICVDHHDRPDPELSNSETLSEGNALPPHPRWPVGALAGPLCQVGSCELLPWQVTWWLRWVRWRGQVVQEFILERCSQVSNISGVKKAASPSQDSGVCSMFVAALQLTLYLSQKYVR